MLFKLTALRHQGKRLEQAEPAHTDASIHTSKAKGFVQLEVSSYFGGASSKVNPLFEPKLLSFEQHRIHLLGFETDRQGQSFAQEWVLELSNEHTMGGHQRQKQDPKDKAAAEHAMINLATARLSDA